MPNPNNIDDIIDVNVNFAEETSSETSFSNPLIVTTFTANPSFPLRAKTYTGNPSTIKAALVDDGFAVTSPTYLMVSRIVDQAGATRTVYVGRRDPTDATLVDALTAIVAVIDDGYHITADPDATTSGEHNAASAWAEDRFCLYHIQTDSAAVYNNTPGNLAATILAAQRSRTVITYHNPAAASGYGPAILRSDTGTFVLPNGTTLELRIGGGATQVFTFTSAAATITGSQVQPFAVTDGDTMVIAVDGGEEQTLTVDLTQAAVTCANAGPYNFTTGMTLLVRRNGAAAVNVTFSGTKAFDLGTVAGPYVIAAAEHLDVAIDGGATQVFVFAGTETTATLVAALINATAAGFSASVVGGAVQLTSNRYGTSSKVEILVTSTAGLLIDLGLPAGSSFGTGFAAFLDVATATEVGAEIDADTTNVIAVDDGSGRVIVSSNTEGTSSRIQITGGTANAILGFDTNEVTGAGDFADGSAITAAQAATWINANSYGLTSTAPATAVVLTSDTTGSASEIERVSGSLLTVFGFTVASSLGSGFAANASAADPSEVSTLISATLTSAAASSASNRVVITSTAFGATASVEAVGGTGLAELFSGSDYAAGTGVAQDYVVAAWIGYGCSIRLDKVEGNSGWDNAGNLVGAYGLAALDPTQRELLQETLRCNTYEQRQTNRAEFHDGVICRNVNALHRYIDQQISADWLDARITEAMKAALDEYANRRTKIPLTDAGLLILGSVMLGELFTAQTNGHTIYDVSTIDVNKPNDTGVFVPKLIDLTTGETDVRRPSGYRAVQRLQNQVQGAIVNITLTNVLPGQPTA